MVNIAMKPRANSIGVLKWRSPPHVVASQLKIFTPVGTAMNIVETAKAEFATGPNPTANMGCARMWTIVTSRLTAEAGDGMPRRSRPSAKKRPWGGGWVDGGA